MKEIISAAPMAAKILRAQKVRDNTVYRPLRYLVRVPVEDGLLVYNVMTKELVLLDREEAGALEGSDCRALQTRQSLICRWFLVPEEQDDRALSQQLTSLAACLTPQGKGITGYTIMPTTDCNARCFYCYEMGRSRTPMSRETALRLVDYMLAHSEGSKLHLRWFGGEPLYRVEIIDLICEKLREAGREFYSSMISNGYLFDAETVARAVKSWNLGKIQITLDGTEEVYNRSKAYVGLAEGVSPYRRVLENMRLLLKAGVRVTVRLNLGPHNREDLFRLVDQLAERFGGQSGIFVYSFPLFETNDAGVVESIRRKRRELYETQLALQDYITQKGLAARGGLRRSIRTGGCMADSDRSALITPDGHIGKCEHFSESEFCSHIDSDQWDQERLRLWKEKAEEVPACRDCAYYPECWYLKKCPNFNGCFQELQMMHLDRLTQGVYNEYQWYLKRQADREAAGQEDEEQENC